MKPELYRAIDAHLARLEKEMPAAPPTSFGGWFRAAAVLHTFDESLKPSPPVDAAESFEDLLGEAIAVTDEAGKSRYTLNREVRRHVLAALGTVDAIKAARGANPGAPRDAVQEMFDGCLTGVTVQLDAATERQLSALFEVSDWLGGIVSGLPDQDAVRAALDRVYLLAPFDDLVGTRFAGRVEELRALRAYVGALPSGGRAWSWLANRAADILDWHTKPPLSIYGPGGIGKSTLLAKFILEHARVDEANRFPFIYLDFDRPDLLAVEPLTILLEAVRQIGIQWPALRSDSERLRVQWTHQIAREQQVGAPPSGSSARQPDQVAAVSERRRFIMDFARLLNRTQMENRPILLVLDTFEEVQSRSQAAVEGTCKFLEELQREMPRLRTVFSGRVPLEKVHHQPLPVLQLEPAAAAAILRQSGMPDAVAERTASWVGGHPMLLRLACELLHRLQEEHGETRGTELFEAEATQARLAQGGVQTFLYSRILEHIKDPRVRALAHPGLALRRITPELIVEVLAAPCHVAVADANDALAILNVMKTEVALVSAAGAREVRHRPDIRKLMLKTAASDTEHAAAIEAIHQAAVAFYATEFERSHASADRAEELYHRLSLNHRAEILDSRWLDDARPLLFSAIDELQPAARAWLAVRLRVELDDDARAASAPELWEWDAVRRATEFLNLNEPQRALDVVRERDFRTDGSALLLLEGQALDRLGDMTAAVDTLEAGVEHTFRTGAEAARTDLLLALADIRCRNKAFDESARQLDAVEALARQRNDIPSLLRAAALRLVLGAGTNTANAGAQPPDRAGLTTLFASATDAVIALVPDAARRVVAEIGADDFHSVRRVLRTIGLGAPDYRKLADLGKALEAWDAELNASREEGRQAPRRGVNIVALRKGLEEAFTSDELKKMFVEELRSEPPTDQPGSKRGGPLVLRLIGAFDQAGLLDKLVARLSEREPKAAANAGKSIGPISRVFDLEYAPEGTIESLVLFAYSAVAPGLDRALDRYDPPRSVIDALCASLRDQASSETAHAPSSTAIDLRLTPEQMQHAATALARAFGSYTRLSDMLRFGLDVSLASISTAQMADVVAADVVRWAQTSKALPQLLSAAIRANPDSPDLQRLVVEVGLVSDSSLTAAAQAATTLATDLTSPERWRRRLVELEGRVCRVDAGSAGSASATGLLVAPDIVLTARSAASSKDGSLGSCHFDYRAALGAMVDQGITVAVSGIVGVDDESECALLRLQSPIGHEPPGGARALPDAPPRGWEPLEHPPANSLARPLLLLYRTPEGSPRLSTIADVKAQPDESYEYRAATEPGAVGAPLFTADFKLSALHQGRSSWFKFNLKRATSIRRVAERANAQGWVRAEQPAG